jgi:diphthine-ammonia ligase
MWYINKKLISEEEWKKEIDSLNSKKIIKEKKEIIELLKKELVYSVEKLLPKEKFGILFSGGVDSTLIAFICKKLKKDFICYSIGLENSQDLEAAMKASKDLGFKLKHKQLSLDEAEKIIKKTVNILGKDLTNVVNVGVGAVEVACFEMAKKDNVKHFFGGLGSEEIFAGYQRHENSNDINKECFSGLRNMWERDLLRDTAIANKYKINLLTPFLDKELIKLSSKIPSQFKIKDNMKKYILREAALDLGLKREFAFRKKKAAQYGSNFDKAIQKLAKINGFKYKKEYLKSLT